MLATERYQDQLEHWPNTGRHILASFDETTVVVYQAYRPSIGHFAVKHGYFGGDFSYLRMSWVKTNVLWMMYRSGWGRKENQETTLALRVRREFFDRVLAEAIPSSWDRDMFDTEEAWSSAVANSSVRLQWDPDHHPSGAKQERRAIQLGFRGGILEDFARRELLEVYDISNFVEEQRLNLENRGVAGLWTPRSRTRLSSR